MPKKQSFLSEEEQSPSGTFNRHLRIVITDPDKDSNQVVVSITTLRFPNSQDTSCILEPGEHKFIKHRSVVDFRRTTIMSFLDIFNGLQKGVLVDMGDISEELLRKIQQAAQASKYIPADIKKLFINF